MNTNMKKTIAGIGAIAVLAVGGTALAGAATENGSTGSTGSTKAAPTGTPPDMASHKSINPNETVLTGDTAAKVKAAATAKVSGTVDRVETDDGGVYEAHITKSDGTHVEVKVDKQFKVTAVNEMGAGGPQGAPGGYGQ
jgi:hypothetical protein